MSRFRSRAIKGIIFVIASVVAVVLIAQFAGDSNKQLDLNGEVLVHSATRSVFESFVTESGDIESANNIEVRCEVRSSSGGATTILRIVPEGSEVVAGDFLVQFDDAALQINLTEQEILVARDEAAVIDAQSELRKAGKSLLEYREGTYIYEMKTIEAEVFQAQEDHRRSEETLAFTTRMVDKGYVPKTQLDAEQFAVQKAQKDLQAAQIKLSVLSEFTLPKMVGEFEADVEKQKANLKAANYTLKLSQQRRDELLDQIKKCHVVAPSGGQVVYANDFERSNNIVIEEGAQVRERQVLIRLPNREEMQVRTRINDSKIKQVKLGNRVIIEVDVSPDLPVHGVVSKVEPFPYPRQWYGGPIEYGAEIKILDPPSTLTPGQRAKVKIFVQKLDDAVQVPIQSVVERTGSHYCLVQNDEGIWRVQSVSIGPNNGSFVVIHEGISEGQRVALNPDLIWDDVFTDEDSSTSSLAGNWLDEDIAGS